MCCSNIRIMLSWAKMSSPKTASRPDIYWIGICGGFSMQQLFYQLPRSSPYRDGHRKKIVLENLIISSMYARLFAFCLLKLNHDTRLKRFTYVLGVPL